MIDLSAQDRDKVDDAVERIVEAAGADLISIALYGEAATAEYLAGRSPLSLVVLVGEVAPAILGALRPIAVRLRGRRVPTPLVVDPDYLERARDVFPLELLELRERHHVLSGEPDVFSRIEIEARSLRHEIEAETRGKMLHLWEDSLTARSRRRLRADILGSVPYFMHILRGMLYLKQPSALANAPSVVAAVEREYALTLPVLARLEQVHRKRGPIPLSEVEDLFASYLDEARALSTVADRL